MPQYVTIAPFVYEIKVVDNLVDGERKLDGWYQYGKSEILLDSELGPQAMRATLWHEILHGILTQNGVKNSDELESVVEILSHGIIGVLNDNPLADFVTGGGIDG